MDEEQTDVRVSVKTTEIIMQLKPEATPIKSLSIKIVLSHQRRDLP